MGEDLLDATECYFVDKEGNKIKIDGIQEFSISTAQEHNYKPSKLSQSFSGTLTMKSVKVKGALKILFKTQAKNIKLQRIYNKTRKPRVKKKLLARMIRNIYTQTKYGF